MCLSRSDRYISGFQFPQTEQRTYEQICNQNMKNNWQFDVNIAIFADAFKLEDFSVGLGCENTFYWGFAFKVSVKNVCIFNTV